MSSSESLRHRPGSGKPGGVQLQAPGKVGWKRPLSQRVLAERSAGFLQRNGNKTGSSAAQWEGWEGTSPFVVSDPAVA